MRGCTTDNVLWNPALDDDPGFCGYAQPTSHARAGAPAHDGRRPAHPEHADVVAILGEHGFVEVGLETFECDFCGEVKPWDEAAPNQGDDQELLCCSPCEPVPA